MCAACCNRDDVAQGRWHIGRSSGSSPGDNSSVGAQCQGVTYTGRNADDSGKSGWDVSRGTKNSGPTGNGTVELQGEAILVIAGDGDDVRQTGWRPHRS